MPLGQILQDTLVVEVALTPVEVPAEHSRHALSTADPEAGL